MTVNQYEANPKVGASRLQLLKETVAANVAYWEKLSQLEAEMAQGEELPFAASEELASAIETLSIGVSTPENAELRVNRDALLSVEHRVKLGMLKH